MSTNLYVFLVKIRKPINSAALHLGSCAGPLLPEINSIPSQIAFTPFPPSPHPFTTPLSPKPLVPPYHWLASYMMT